MTQFFFFVFHFNPFVVFDNITQHTFAIIVTRQRERERGKEMKNKGERTSYNQMEGPKKRGKKTEIILNSLHISRLVFSIENASFHIHTTQQHTYIHTRSFMLTHTHKKTWAWLTTIFPSCFFSHRLLFGALSASVGNFSFLLPYSVHFSLSYGYESDCVRMCEWVGFTWFFCDQVPISALQTLSSIYSHYILFGAHIDSWSIQKKKRKTTHE